MTTASRALAVASLAVALLAPPAAAAPALFKIQTRPATAGAEVRVDGLRVGVTNGEGALFASLEPGRRRVQVLVRGAVLADAVHQLEADLNHVAVEVRAPRVKVLVDTNVGGATVRVDGRAAATTAADGRTLLELPGAARYAIAVEKSGYRDATARVSLTDLDHKLSLTLAPLPPSPPIPPEALWRAAEAYFAGDYAATLERLAGVRFAERRAEAEAALFLGAAHHALHLLAGGQGNHLQAATEAVARCRSLDPALNPDSLAFSPQFVAFFAAAAARAGGP